MRIRWTGGQWPLLVARGVLVLASLGLLIYIAMWGVDLARRISAASSGTAKPSAEQQLAATQAELAKLQAEHEQSLQAAAAKAKAEAGQSARLKQLEAEIGRLNEDLDALAKHLPQEKGKPGIARLRAGMEGKQLKYRFYVTQSNKKVAPDVSLVVTTAGGDLKFPGCALSLAAVSRCEGKLDLPAGAVATQVEARLLEKGQVRVSQTANVYND